MVFPSLSAARRPEGGGAPARALPQPPRRPRAAGAAREHPARSCSCSTTCTGPIRLPSSCSARSSTGRRPRRCCSPWRCARARCRSGYSASIERAHRAGTLHRFELAALTRGEAAEFLGDTVGGAEAAELFEESGGNPFYLEQLARMLDRAGSWRRPWRPSSRWAVSVFPPPWPQRSRRSSASSPRPLGACSRARPWPATRSIPSSPPPPRARPRRRRWTRSTSCSASTSFATRTCPGDFGSGTRSSARAVYESTPGGWRLGAHERSAEALEARGAPASARAHHVELAARQGDAAAVATLREAGEATAQRAPASAARWFDAALRMLSEDAPAEERVELLLARSEALAATGQFAESHATLIESIRIVPEDASALRVRLDRRLRRRRAPARPARGGPRPARARPRRAPGPCFAGGGGADDRARRSTASVRGDFERHGPPGRPGFRRRTTARRLAR